MFIFSKWRKSSGEEQKNGSSLGFHFLERERELILSRFAAIRTVGSRRSKKQSRSTWRGLRMDTDLEEFRQLQEVGIFSYL